MRQDMRTTHEEADAIMTSQALQIALEKTPVTVVSDDTDVFLLLLHFTESNNIDTPVYMEATKGERTVIDIIETKAIVLYVRGYLLPMLLQVVILCQRYTVLAN